MSTTIADTDASVGPEVIQRPVASTPAKAKVRRDPIWPILVVSLGLLASLAWSGFLGWMVGRMTGML
jgi:hypothetical protein